MRAATSIAFLLAATASAHAETPADAAFRHGREQFKAGQFAQACTSFEESERLDPAVGTQFNIAQCDEKIGKLLAAAHNYADVIANDTNASRKATAADLAGKLAARIPHLHVQVEHAPADLAVTLDGAAQGGTTDLPVDLGAHTVTVAARGFTAVTAHVDVTSEGVTVPVAIVLVAGPVAAPPVAPASVVQVGARPPPAPDEPHRSRLPVIAVAGGGALIAGGVVAGILAHGKWNAAKAVCGGLACSTSAEVDQATALGDAAHSRATISTVLFVAGAAAAATGVVLWVRSSGEHETRVSAIATPGAGAVTLSGRF